MAVRSGFFNSNNGDRKYDARRFAEYFATFIGNGVFPNPSNNLQIVANNDMTVTVKAGKAWINGYILINDDDYILNIEPADGVLNRIDRIVARYDVVDREIALQVKQGDYATEAVAPELQRDADAYELALADVLINNGATEITQANITDNRLNDELCGIVHGVVDQVDTTTLFNQYQSWLAQQRDYYEENIENWTADQQADFLAWRQAETNDFNIWQANEKADFEDWVDSIQGILDENAAGNLQLQISDLQDYTDGVVEDLDEHKAEKATQDKYGHIRLQDIPSPNIANIEDLRINDKLELEYNDGTEWKSSNWKDIDDRSGSPGANMLVAGTMQEGFFGEVPARDLITGDALASECGISQGTSQHSTAGWLKFAYKGEIQFVAKKPIRHSISWDAINTANCVYGDSGDKTVVIGGKTYKVTLMRALEPTNDPKTVASASGGEVNHGSEWNRLMCQIHEQALSKSWDYPDNVENDIGILEHNLGNGSQGMYDDADLLTHYDYGNGSRTWCQEMSTSTSDRLYRGINGASGSSYSTSSTTNSGLGWRPVLRLVS